MNNSYHFIFYILLIIYSFGIFSEEKIFFNRNNFRNLCKRLNDFKIRIDNLENLNAYDRAEERITINKEKSKFLDSYFIIHLKSDEFELSDYNFLSSSFKIENIKLKSGMEIVTDKDILLNIKKENAKMIAAKKKLGILDLYLKVKLKNMATSYDDYCNSKNKKIIKIRPKIYEYFFMCAQSNNVIDYELLYEKKDKFISSPFVDLTDEQKLKEVNYKFSVLEKSVYKCKIRFDGYGTKIYELKIDSNGESVLINKGASFSSKKLEDCIDREIIKQHFPKSDKEYSIYFSIVVSNIK